MKAGRIILTTAAAVVLILVATSPLFADDAGWALDAGVSAISPDAISMADTTPVPVLPEEGELLKDLHKAVTEKDWFMLAGVGLAGLVMAVRWGLKKRWATWEKSHYGVFLAAGIAALTTLSLAWLADEPVMSSHSLIGSLKLFAAATLAYVVPRKLAAASAAI